MRRTIVTLGVVSLFAACGFPEVTYDNAGDDAGGDARADATSADGASSGGDASETGDSTSSEMSEAGDGEASTGTDAAGDSSDSSMAAETASDGPATDGDATADSSDSGNFDAPHDAAEEQPPDSGTDAPVCDNDGDHDLAKGAVCGGTDCDDNDARAYLGEPNFLTFTPTPVTKGDWNCDGIVTTQFTTGFSCGLLSLGSCGATSGFTDTPGCGVTSANFITCHVVAAAFCETDTTSSNTQGCK